MNKILFEKMTFVANDTKIREIRQGDYDFFISDGVKLSPRAYIEVSDVCPHNIKLAIHKAMADGYTMDQVKQKYNVSKKVADLLNK